MRRLERGATSSAQPQSVASLESLGDTAILKALLQGESRGGWWIARTKVAQRKMQKLF